MDYPDFETAVKKIVNNDTRYSVDAYEFIGEAVNYTAMKLKKDESNIKTRHVSCQELLRGVTEYAITHYGPMAGDVFENWGLTSSQAIGNVVFNMINEQLLSASEDDNVEQFEKGPSFTELFRKPFQPTGKTSASIIDY